MKNGRRHSDRALLVQRDLRPRPELLSCTPDKAYLTRPTQRTGDLPLRSEVQAT